VHTPAVHHAPLPAYWRVTRIAAPLASIAIAPASWLIAQPDVHSLTFILASVVFGVAAPLLCSITAAPRGSIVVIALMGFSFIAWGILLGACIPWLGVTGIIQASISGSLICVFIDRKRVISLFVRALVPAWAAALVWPHLAQVLKLPPPSPSGGWDLSRGDFFPPLVAVWNAVALWALAGEARKGRVSRAKPGTCDCCHYDLRGNTTGLCPECGTPFAKHLDLNPRP
jgi:hypothetical protein